MGASCSNSIRELPPTPGLTLSHLSSQRLYSESSVCWADGKATMGSGLSSRHVTKRLGEATHLRETIDKNPTKGNENHIQDRDSVSSDHGLNMRCDLPGHKAWRVQKLVGGQGKTRRKEIWTSTEPGGREFSLSSNEKNPDHPHQTQ